MGEYNYEVVGASSPPQYRIFDENDDRIATCFCLDNARLVVSALNAQQRISTDYDKIRNQPGYYWTRGVLDYRDPDRWFMARVYKPCWTKESGKDHCQWFYMDGSGGTEIDKGEWVLISEPEMNGG